ncbi:MAG: hypothetical protein OSB60_14390, partial [Myxococcota bacterium]|nr:hypothetical protein [Myxococcota bacterium]
QRPVALIDLVETKTPEANRAFVTKATQIARETGGRRVLANKAIVPMIVPDKRASKPDHATGLFVVTWYPTPEAGRIALAKRKEWGPELSTDPIRTYTLRPSRGIESFVQRTLPSALGLLARTPVPKIDDEQKLESLIEGALILGEEPDEARWARLAERAGDRPIWMLNFLEYAETAVYAHDTQDAAPLTKISGDAAYQLYVRGMIGTLGAVGGRVGWSGRRISALPGTDDGHWHQVAIAVYPSPAAMMTMLAQPKYRAAHVHRAAALARTRLLATQPIEGL